MIIVMATMVVTSVMVVVLKVAMTYLVTCKFTGTRQVNLQELPFVLLLLRISGLTTSICIFDCSYFLAISFGLMDILPTLEIAHDVSVPLTITIQQIGFVPEYHFSFVFLIFTYKIFFLSMLCCECEASIIKSGLLSHLNNERVMIRSLYSP